MKKRGRPRLNVKIKRISIHADTFDKLQKEEGRTNNNKIENLIAHNQLLMEEMLKMGTNHEEFVKEKLQKIFALQKKEINHERYLNG